MKKIENEVSAYLKSLTNSGNPFSNSLQKSFPAFRLLPASVTLKVVPKAACNSENVSESRGHVMYTGEN